MARTWSTSMVLERATGEAEQRSLFASEEDVHPPNGMVVDHLAVECRYQSSVELEKIGQKRKGRLGRLTYEFRVANTANGNRRIYPSELYKAAFLDFKMRVDRGQVGGNLDHPSPWDPNSDHVRLSEAAVKITPDSEMLDDERVRIIADILDNPHGRQLVSVIEAKMNPGLSQRATAMFREATDDDRQRFGLPDDVFIIVAESLRLITYDIVSQPSHADAQGATISEQQTGAALMDLTLETLRTKHPELYRQVTEAGRREAQAEVDRLVEERIAAQRGEIVDEAVKQTNEKLQQIQESHNKLLDALTKQVKPLLVEHEIVNEQITDAEAARENERLKGELERVTEELKTVKAANEDLQKRLTAIESKGRHAEILRKVSGQLADQPAKVHDAVLEELDREKPETLETALERAHHFVRLFGQFHEGEDGGTGNANGDGTALEGATFDVRSLYRGNKADPEHGSGALPNGGANEGANNNNGQVSTEALNKAALAGLSGFGSN